MARTMTRRQSEERKTAVLKYFSDNPDATGDEAQALLVAGELTGKPGQPMGLGVLYELKRQASGVAPRLPGRAAIAKARTTTDLDNIRRLARALQAELRAHPEIAEVRVTATAAEVLQSL